MINTFSKNFINFILVILAIIQIIVLFIIGRPDSKLIDISVTSIAPISSLKPDGTVQYKGQDFFPIGFYHVSWAGNQTNLTDAINKVADMGFNTMYIAPDETWTTALDAAKNRNIKLIVDGDGSDNALEGVIDSTKNIYDNILAWGIADDFNSTTKPKTPSSIEAIKNSTRQKDPTRISFMSGTGAAAHNPTGYFSPGAELIGIQTYPIGDPTTTIDEVYEYMNRLVPSATATGKPIIANLQTYAWPGKRSPTPAELRNMTYQSIVAGVKGIVYYTYLDESWNLSNKADLLTELSTIGPELSSLSPVLLNGVRTSLGIKDNVVASSWLKDGKTYFIAVNTSNSAKSTNFSLSSANDLESKPGKIIHSPINGTLNINLAPLEVLILESKNDSEQPDSVDCGLMDQNNDGRLTIIDFDKFVRFFKKSCTDTPNYIETPTTVKCGPMDSNLNSKIDIGDLGYVAKYFRKECGV